MPKLTYKYTFLPFSIFMTQGTLLQKLPNFFKV